MEELEMICFEIISSVGTARSCYIESIRLSRQGKFDEAESQIREGKQIFEMGHKAHGKLIQREASGEKTEGSILLIHAEDQMMSAETFGILAEEFLELNKIIREK